MSLFLPVYHSPAHPCLRLTNIYVPSTVCGNEVVNGYECIVLGEGRMCMRYRLSAKSVKGK